LGLQEKELKVQMESIKKQKAPLKALLQGAGLIVVRRKKVVEE
jgi:hypothetical protein